MNTLQTVEAIKQIKEGNIIMPQGFKASGVHAGLRYSKKDVGIIYTETPASAAAVYTQNIVQAAPITVTKDSIAVTGKINGIVVNSACANACTGEQGLRDAIEMRKLAATKFGLEDHTFAVASTGVIGEYMEMEKVKKGIEALEPENTLEGARDFGTAILTTDIVTKSCGYEAVIDGKTVKMGGAAKGSGMIHPNMATMLGFITTDAVIESADLHLALSSITNDTFNQITVDGDCSTNDMVLVLANGEANNEPLTPAHPEWSIFLKLLTQTSENLAKQIAKDGEGATKLIEVNVHGMHTKQESQMMAKTIVGSNLVKTAAFGADANWGRIIAAMGRSGVEFQPDHTTIMFGDILVLKDGEPIQFSEEDAKAYLENESIIIHVYLKEGQETGTAWGCDLTYDYVKINGSYRS
ncbi:bifunctional ornithine acetyltransferase/N-acetylglutamate synthase [Peribacillus muralis]|uniref:bifunctional ornithine acetyltransferase/N-acetylglutamate synthase n=1 Tax=Peribacillus muralis TaxID=264697 RepID=UPI001F4E2132|nr:bifunctional ornithine acetyltransferase/N-acetylglutamate synthase [Peribacillus muralis]MCK1992871.1 bifunctional ornithine acetyltransferase/N-acetylglutamate synthase [Peribacillus muralis]MCK2013426.1 bifunctional ornithine acetyltransferase/N-acetylglutamate synthase [Peribacillus muralis]